MSTRLWDDCCETMRVRKMHHYRDHLEDLRLQGIIYTPLIWSCWGREHEDTTKVLRQIARAAARRRGDKYDAVLSTLRDAICAALARRSAAMLLSCMPLYEHSWRPHLRAPDAAYKLRATPGLLFLPSA